MKPEIRRPLASVWREGPDGQRYVHRFEPSKDYHAWIESDAWREIRDKTIDRADHTCERCGEQRWLQVHHKHYRSLGHEQPEDLEVLCRDCHQDEHYPS